MNPRQVAVIGGGLIGGGWAARFLLHGYDVNVYDLDPDAERKLDELLASARKCFADLHDAPLPREGTLTHVTSLSAAVADAFWIQESVPERLEIKHAVIGEIQAQAPADALIGSSTSGYKPSQLQEGASNPRRIIVAHPFNPVYLLPLVEVVGTPNVDADVTEIASQTLKDIGMKPLFLRKEIDAHIADRLLEAVWREGLWLIKDGIATTEEIDDAIRFGFGLRWAQMGLFETYRVAGGEAGMAHFVGQFGPHLKSPWTKLMDVPDLDDELVERIATQSDAQSGQYSIHELEQIRDANLVAMMRALRTRSWGAGAIVAEHEARLQARVDD
jgi:carnitine 3-dehydrogenase